MNTRLNRAEYIIIFYIYGKKRRKLNVCKPKRLIQNLPPFLLISLPFFEHSTRKKGIMKNDKSCQQNESKNLLSGKEEEIEERKSKEIICHFKMLFFDLFLFIYFFCNFFCKTACILLRKLASIYWHFFYSKAVICFFFSSLYQNKQNEYFNNKKHILRLRLFPILQCIH